MKNRLYLFLIMFSIWCGINTLMTLILPIRFKGFYFDSFHAVNYYVPFILCVVAAVSVRYFNVILISISIYTACCLIPGLIYGNLTGDGGFIPVEDMNNGLFVHNEYLLIVFMNWFYDKMSINVAIILSDVIIILSSAYLMLSIRGWAIELIEMWYKKLERDFWVRFERAAMGIAETEDDK